MYLGKQRILISCFLFSEDTVPGLMKLQSSFWSEPKWVGEICTSHHTRDGSEFKSQGRDSVLQNGEFDLPLSWNSRVQNEHWVQTSSTHKSVLFPFYWLLSLAHMLRTLILLRCHMLSIWESHGHGTEIKAIGRSELLLELVLTNAILRILSQWYLQTPYNN